ncbi:MAG TPA: ABC transporter [Streptosporangiaceae bacterium]|nr:ABC transporter [Streptosporangiaceae bacterium]
MTATLTAQVSDGAERAGLSGRLTALARLVQIGAARTGPDGFGEDLLAEASDLLTRAGQRLTLSSRHTVVSLAGGTGSGKSSLFNQLAGADFSTVGVTRPVTRAVHACVWGVAGSGPLLEWLGVPRRHRYARASALGTGEQSMSGLVLLDLPDHDSVMGHATNLVDQLVGLSDLIVWVLDPQKYADAAVHRRFLVPLAGHSEVIAVVLNQADVLSAGQIEDCVHDLRRLLDSEGLTDVQILVTSAKSGAGIEELRKLLIEAVTARKAATARISADVGKVVAKFEPYGAIQPAIEAGPSGSAEADQNHLRPGTAAELATDFATAAGVPAIGDALRSARELRAMDYVGWPVSWLAERLTSPDPVRRVRLGKLWDELRGVQAGPSGAQQAEIDNALTKVADGSVPPLPPPWSRTVRAAVRSRSAEVPARIGEEIGASLPAGATVDRWWRLTGVVQGLLLGCVLVGIVWLASLIILGLAHVGSGIPSLFSDPWLLPWAVLVVAVGLTGGWLVAGICTRAVSQAAEREIGELAEDIRRRLTAAADDLVLAPAESELDELERFRAELRTAAGSGVPDSSPGWAAGN